MRTTGFLLLAAALGVLPLDAHALEAGQTFRAEYRISFLGFRIASSSFSSNFSGDTFHLEGRIESAGLARLFDRTTAATRVTGRMDGHGVEPLEYQLMYVSGGERKRTEIRFADGEVTETDIHPPPKPRGKDWVPLGANDLKAVFDPITATILRAASPEDVCNRTIRAYDGEIRVDLRLRHAGMKPFSTNGFRGVAVACTASFRPVSGYRKGRRALEFMQRRSRIEIAFAPVGADGIYAPVMATVDTEIGPVRLHATRFSTVD